MHGQQNIKKQESDICQKPQRSVSITVLQSRSFDAAGISATKDNVWHLRTLSWRNSDATSTRHCGHFRTFCFLSENRGRKQTMDRMLRRPNSIILIVITMMTTTTLWSAFLSKKLTVVQIARKLAAFYAPRRTFAIFTAAILRPLTQLNPKWLRQLCLTSSLLVAFWIKFLWEFQTPPSTQNQWKSLKIPTTLNCPILFTIAKTYQSISIVSVYDVEAFVDNR